MQNAAGYCSKCKDMMVTENGVPKCFNCMPVRKSKLVATEIPNDKTFRQVMKESNAPSLPQSQRKAPVVQVGKAEMVVTGNTAQDALAIMKNLPMPKDMKEFKQIQKIIQQLEKLVGE